MLSSVNFEWRQLIANRRDLRQISCQERSDRAESLILMDVPQFVREKPVGYLALADKDGVTECDPGHVRTKQPGLEANSKKLRVRWLRQLIHNLDSNQIGTLDADCDGKLRTRVRQRLSNGQHMSYSCLDPGDRKGQQSR